VAFLFENILIGKTLKSNSIIQIIENEPRISHKVIAKHTGNKDVSIRKLIDKYIEQFELFGVVSFEMTAVSEDKLKENPDLKPSKTYFLNEPQATLLLTFLRNNDVVLNFKVDLVRAFFEMRKELNNVKSVEKTNYSEMISETKEVLQLIDLMKDLSPKELFYLQKIMGENSPTKLLGNSFRNSYFLPTEIGKITGQTGAEINLILEKKGFQFRDEKGVWKPTENGKIFCLEIENAYNQLKWKLETVL
jgi:phage regulator Rha-like protein